METIEIYTFYGILPVLLALVGHRLRKYLAAKADRERRGREVLGIAEIVRERHRALLLGLAARPLGVSTRLYETSSVVTEDIGRLAYKVRVLIVSAVRCATSNPARANVNLGHAGRAIMKAEELLERRDAQLRDAVLELRCILRHHLEDAIAAQQHISERVEAYRREGYRLAVEAAGLHMLGRAYASLEPLIVSDPDGAEALLEKHVRRMRDLSRAAARKIAHTKRVRDLSGVFPQAAARARAAAFSVIRMRFDLDPRVDRETSKVVRDFDPLLRKAEAMMAVAKEKVASGHPDLTEAERDASRAVLLCSLIEGRIIAALEATSAKAVEGKPLSRTTILH
jgi:hypothetical protein